MGISIKPLKVRLSMEGDSQVVIMIKAFKSEDESFASFTHLITFV